MNDEPALVMLIEDNADHAELVMRALAKHRGADHVRHFLDGSSALDYLFHRGAYTDVLQHPYPRVILLDLRLPRLDGLEVLKQIKASDEIKRIPVVVLTTSEADRDVAQAYDHHVNSYLVKPVGYDAFNELMKDLGSYWLGWNTPARV